MNTNNDSAVVQLGSNQTFSVESIACGLPIISWMDSQGRDIASGTTLTLTDIKKADAGVYRLVRRALFSDSVSSSGRRFPNSFAKSMSFFGYSIQPTAVLKTSILFSMLLLSPYYLFHPIVPLNVATICKFLALDKIAQPDLQYVTCNSLNTDTLVR